MPSPSHDVRAHTMVRRSALIVYGITIILSISVIARADDLAIDGLLADWATIPVLATDPAGDSSGPLDVTAIRAQSRGSVIFLQIDFNNSFNLSSGPTTDPLLRMIVANGASTVTVDFRARTAYLNGNAANVISWPALGFFCLPTTATTRFEMRLDAAAIGAGLSTTLEFSFAGADSFAAPASFTLTEPPAIPARRSAARLAGPSLRIASFNTLFTGLTDAARRDACIRLIDSVNADIYCFQEEYNSTAAQVLAAITEADPRDNGETWNVLKFGGLAIASPFPLTPAYTTPAYHAVLVRPPGGPDTLVINTHMKCCGYAGNTDDSQRISQATAAVAFFNQFRAGTLSPALAPFSNAPAVVLGDWNLVGSTTPRDLWTAAPMPGVGGLTHAIVRHLVGDDTWTWAAPSGLGFWPGVLDLVVYDALGFRLANSFILDTAELDPSELAALGLLAADSTASDHRMKVLDFTTAPSASFNGVGGVSTQDIFDFLAAYFAGCP